MFLSPAVFTALSLCSQQSSSQTGLSMSDIDLLAREAVYQEFSSEFCIDENEDFYDLELDGLTAEWCEHSVTGKLKMKSCSIGETRYPTNWVRVCIERDQQSQTWISYVIEVYRED